MSNLDETQLQNIFKQSTLELLQQRKDLCYDLFPEMLGDLALENVLRKAGANRRTAQQTKERHS